MLTRVRTRRSHASHDWFHGNEEARYAYGGFNTVLMVATWLPFPGSIICFDGVGWFVSTIFFCYLTFPSLLPYLQECSRSTQQQWIWGACILPMVIVPLLARVIIDSSGVAMDEVILMIYKHPLYRLPQFVLGVLGGLLAALMQSSALCLYPHNQKTGRGFARAANDDGARALRPTPSHHPARPPRPVASAPLCRACAAQQKRLPALRSAHPEHGPRRRRRQRHAHGPCVRSSRPVPPPPHALVAGRLVDPQRLSYTGSARRRRRGVRHGEAVRV